MLTCDSSPSQQRRSQPAGLAWRRRPTPIATTHSYMQSAVTAFRWIPNAVGKALEFLDDDPVLICLNIAAAIAPDGHDADNDPARDAQWWKITSMSPPAGTVVRKLNQLP